jgi:hypothetical protein
MSNKALSSARGAEGALGPHFHHRSAARRVKSCLRFRMKRIAVVYLCDIPMNCAGCGEISREDSGEGGGRISTTSGDLQVVRNHLVCPRLLGQP